MMIGHRPTVGVMATRILENEYGHAATRVCFKRLDLQ